MERLLEAGAVGCNLEDSEDGVLKDPRAHADRLAEVRAAAGDRLFVNARVDTFSCGVADPERAIERAALYVAAGADCVYPIGAPPEVLPLLRAGIQGPVNVGALTDEGPSPAELGARGATRITFGPGLQRRAARALREIAMRPAEAVRLRTATSSTWTCGCPPTSSPPPPASSSCRRSAGRPRSGPRSST